MNHSERQDPTPRPTVQVFQANWLGSYAGWAGVERVPVALLIGFAIGGLSGCIVAPGYATLAPGPVYVTP